MSSSHRCAIAFLLLAGVFGVWRQRQTTVVIPGPAFGYSYLNDLRWDRDTATFTRTGGDPYAWVEVPASTIPLRQVTVEFAGTYQPGDGAYYFFQSPAWIGPLALGNALPATVTRHADGFAVSARFTRSKVLRLDLPDHLSRPVTLRRITLHSAYDNGGRVFRLALGCACAALVAFVWPPLRAAIRRWLFVEYAVCAALVAVKLVLASDVQVSLAGTAMHDDALLVHHAASIVDGKWLGAFNELTLAKGPMFSLFLAGVSQLGVRLMTAQALLHALACLVFVVAVRRLVGSAAVRLLLFAVLLFDPYTLSASVVGRVLRTDIQPALALLTLAGAIAVADRVRDSGRAALGWAALCGLAAAAFWYSREEGIWLLPALGVIGAVAVWHSWQLRGSVSSWRIAALVLPVAIFFSAGWALRLTNARHYGAPVAVDVKDGAFPDAYGALTRITPSGFIPGVPVSRETRLRAYAVSPAFAELRSKLEGPIGDRWCRYGWEGSTSAVSGKEIRGGWFQWALREAAARTGYYRDARTADAYWRKLADEINAACDRGQLAGGPRRRGFAPRWQATLAAPLGAALLESVKVTVAFSDFSLFAVPNDGSEAQIAEFRRITHEPGAEGVPEFTPATAARGWLAALYQALGAVAAGVGVAATALLMVLRDRSGNEKALRIGLLVACLGAATGLIGIVALIDVTSFSAAHAIYLAPASPLILAVCVLAPAWAIEHLQAGRAGASR